jgi:aminopeptidase N
VLHNLRCTINNDTLFFSLIRDFCKNNQYKTVNSEDFTRFVNSYTGSDYTPFFNIFLYNTDLPVLSYSYEKADGELIITYRWTGVEDGFFMPFGIRINGAESLRLEATTVSQEIRIPEGSYFYFHNLWNGYTGSRDNSFTYFITNCTNYN